MAWDDALPACFGVADLIFAMHDADEERALQWLISLRKRGASFAEVEAQIREFLSEKATPKHIDEQVARARVHIKPWLPY